MLNVLSILTTLVLPVMGLSWWLFHRLYSLGEIDRNASPGTVRKSLKDIKTDFALHRKAEKMKIRDEKLKLKEGGSEPAQPRQKTRKKFVGIDYVQANWMKFGGGFYGLTALWTFFYIEISDAIRLLFNWSAITALFSDGIISLLVGFLSNQLTNVITAFVWFSYWPGDNGSIVFCLVAAYAAYFFGMQMARSEIKPETEQLEKYHAEILGQVKKVRISISTKIRQKIEALKKK